MRQDLILVRLNLYARVKHIPLLEYTTASDRQSGLRVVESALPEAYIYACNRGGCGESDGTLQAVTSVRLAIVPLEAVKDCTKPAENSVDNIILRVVHPVGEAGSNVECLAALKAGLNKTAPDVQISRFCNSGLDAVKFAAAQMMSGQHELVVGAYAESTRRVCIDAFGGVLPMSPSIGGAY
ncbi:hypothetical protein [Bradyrhizobium sp. 141]|uniref:thiolase family protein n=1 Tax=Bradyrhizobium sp. 141 TaxID=2782617 RepID=UPI001FF86D4C|nr:hypothetical protein [Bradyrhizobium sp. 141]MCK1717588.1 hypothetical protein [Bradyrhizobium sp. 141]